MGWINRSTAAVWGAGRWLGSLGRSEPQNVTDLSGLLLDSLGYATKSGVSVNAETALRVTDVLACLRVLAEGVSQCPIKVIHEDEKGAKRIAREHPLHDVLSVEPNEWDTSFSFRETLMYHAVMTKSSFSFINRVRGTVKEIIPLKPGMVDFDPDRRSEEAYKIQTNDGVMDLPARGVLHFSGPRWHVTTGLDIIGLSREAIGLAMVLDQSWASLHKNGLRPSIALQHEKGMDDAKIKRVAALIKAAHGGVGNAFRPLFIDNGWKLEKLATSGVEAQHLETRLNQLRAICRALRVFPQMVGDSDKTSTYASAEQFFIAHVVHSLMPWVERLEQSLNKWALTQEERRAGYKVKIFTEGLLRGDSRARAAFYQVMVLTGVMTRNECRALEDLNAIDGLDDPLVPLNMGIAGQPDGSEAGSSSDPSPRLPNMPIAPLSLVNKLMGHNGGPPLDDMVLDAVQAHLPALEAMGNQAAVRKAKAMLSRRAGGEPVNVGRVLSGENEALIRGASDNLTTVLSKLDSQED